MKQTLSLITLVVDDYDQAIAHYTGALGFELLEDTDLGNGKRWVRVAPQGSNESGLLLAKASDDTQRARIGDQTGGRVGFFLQTDDFWRDHRAMTGKGVEFLETPREEDYGIVAVFRDRYGNKWDLLELKA
ncbi:VOC family protein [Pseudoxanthomonas sacheonensis]|uniref:Catechol 2,3-dioxygenase-like lactoylglutathione lyase family enzyme n=1 Tax=Pseudoxanthomonas sacheonensis TaxID=443615 RepID=A0ABU1RLV6_9GAMM|nr:VOC family protein [Pseudoxanthomonas sacheonensis]MDR6839754.1 catechol 2,3-dioxygenase-like lactoylglutathione lyase family enzyme [Pseudoxanthomonas sacheonensis]